MDTYTTYKRDHVSGYYAEVEVPYTVVTFDGIVSKLLKTWQDTLQVECYINLCLMEAKNFGLDELIYFIEDSFKDLLTMEEKIKLTDWCMSTTREGIVSISL